MTPRHLLPYSKKEYMVIKDISISESMNAKRLERTSLIGEESPIITIKNNRKKKTDFLLGGAFIIISERAKLFFENNAAIQT